MKRDSILLVDDDPGTVSMMSHMLGGVGELRFAVSGADALRLANLATPDLILLDAEMPGMSGFQLFDQLKDDVELARVPVIFVTSHGDADFEVAGFELGAADFIAKPIDAAPLVARVRARLRFKHMADEWRRIATVDPLTELANRRRFDESLEREWLRCRRSGDALALLLVDIDHFSRFNERYGRPAGDACLRLIAQSLAGASLRPGDLVARIEGDSFALLLPQTPRAGAEHMAHRVLDVIEALDVRHESSPLARHVTATVGIGCHDAESAGWVEPSPDSRFARLSEGAGSGAGLLEAAGQALAAAKQAGRAQARLLDLGDLGFPAAVRDIHAGARPRQPRNRAGSRAGTDNLVHHSSP